MSPDMHDPQGEDCAPGRILQCDRQFERIIKSLTGIHRVLNGDPDDREDGGMKAELTALRQGQEQLREALRQRAEISQQHHERLTALETNQRRAMVGLAGVVVVAQVFFNLVKDWLARKWHSL